MTRFFATALLFILTNIAAAQNFQGQWKGGFIDRSTSNINWGGDRCDYVVDIDVDGDNVTGFSYTYFTDGGKKYYTICRLEGFIDKKKKYLEVTEISRTKTNVPVNISNSFQVHKLTWRKEGGEEILEGTWRPAPGQNSKNAGTGYGTTVLSKRLLADISPLAKKVIPKKDIPLTPEKPSLAVTKPKKEMPVTAKKITSIPQKTPAKITPPVVPVKPDLVVKPTVPKKDTSFNSMNVKITTRAEKILPPGFENRSNAVLQTVSVENASVKLELYDNGDVDGDSISLFYNGKVLLAHKRLSETPILLEIPVPVDEVNELVMYADNLGTLPPNTALMIVRDGNKRYEVRITSDLKKSGTIRFIHKKNE